MEVKKKSYNPLKMWGSWVGLVLYPILTAVFWTGASQLEGFPKLLEYVLGAPIYPFMLIAKLINDLSGCVGEDCWIFLILGVITSSLIAGFLIGYGIHSLIRRFKN